MFVLEELSSDRLPCLSHVPLAHAGAEHVRRDLSGSDGTIAEGLRELLLHVPT